MPTAIIIEKNGSLKEFDCDKCDEVDFYKFAGLKRKSKDFKRHTTWEVLLNGNTYFVKVYGKDTGSAGQENKYELPPPVDNTLFFGPCLLINTNVDGDIINLNRALWKTIYDHLFGGFEDIGAEDSEDEEDDEDDDVSKTKEGYAKDGFIVDDEDVEEEEEEEDEEEEEEEEEEDEAPARRRRSSRKAKPTKAKVVQNVFLSLQKHVDEDGLECTSELSEEDYV